MWNLLDATDPLSLALAETAAHDECSASMPGDDALPPFDPAGLFTTPERLTVQFALPYNRDRVAAMVASTSVAILASEADREQLLDAARNIVPDGNFFLSWICEAWFSVKLGAEKITAA
jgi:hypothetical protein